MGEVARRRPRSAGLVALALLAGACSVEPGTMPGHQEALALPDAPAPTPGFGLLADHGVTPAPCPDAVNPDNGCIELGALVDTSGPTATFGRAALAGAQAFWQHVNEQGGVTHKREDGLQARYDVLLDEHVEDNVHDVQAHLRALEEVEPDVLALALSSGTTMTAEALPEIKRADLVTVPFGWWSGWPFEPLVAESGASACFQAVNGMDWALAQLGGGVAAIDRVVVVHTSDRDGRDVRDGVTYWSDPDRQGPATERVPFDPTTHAVPVDLGDDVTPVVELIDEVRPDVVVLATGPDEVAEIVRETADLGWHGQLVGTTSSFEPSLLEDPTVAEVLESRFWHVGNVGPLTQGGQAYVDMRTALGLGVDRQVEATDAALPANHAWIAGWVGQYPLHTALKEAIAAGDLTRAGVAHALEEALVRYDGALPRRHEDGVPNDQVSRRTFVSRPDRDAPLGLRLVGDAYVGRTAETMYVTRPCTEG